MRGALLPLLLLLFSLLFGPLHLLQRVLAGEVDAALAVDFGDLDHHHVAHVDHVLHLLHPLFVQLGDVDQPLFAGGAISTKAPKFISRVTTPL